MLSILETGQIKNIIFDLGKVFTEVDFEATVVAFNSLSKGGRIDLYSYKAQQPLFDQLETGKISPSEFLLALKAELKEGVQETDILNAWNAMLGSTSLKLLQAAAALRPKFKTYILSNTNEIHIKWINNWLLSNLGQPDLNFWFDEVFLSHEIGARKPEPEAYQYVLNKEDLIANETLFIDDKSENVEAAQSLNIHGIVLTKHDDLLQWLT